VRFRIDDAALAQALDRRIHPTLPTEWPGNDECPVCSSSVSDHLDYLHSRELGDLSRNAVLAALVESANAALYQFSDGVSEDAREPYNGCVTLGGDLRGVRVGGVPRSDPDVGTSCPEPETITIAEILPRSGSIGAPTRGVAASDSRAPCLGIGRWRSGCLRIDVP
jgi:hypothetical protein